MANSVTAPSLQFFEINDSKTLDSGALAIHYWTSIDSVENLRQIVEENGNPIDITKTRLLVTDIYGNSCLHYAASCSAYKCAEYIVSLIQDYPFFNSRHETPAHIAAQNGDVRMLKILNQVPGLLTEKTNRQWIPLHYAIYYRRQEAVEYLVESYPFSLYELTAGAECTNSVYSFKNLRFYSALDIAVEKGFTEISDFLIEHHALPSFHAAVRSHNLQAISHHLFILENRDLKLRAQYRNSTVLHIAAAFGYYSICHSLLQSGADANVEDSGGFSPIELASIANSYSTVLVLLPHSSLEYASKALFIAADLGFSEVASTMIQSGKFSSQTAPNGDSLLIRLIKRGLLTIAIDLLKFSPDLSHRDGNGATALHYAAATNNTQLISLVAQGSEINATDNLGRTPLMYGVLSGSNEGIKLLQSANPDAVDKFGMTPFAAYAIFDLVNSPIEPSDKTYKMTYDVDVEKISHITSIPRDKVILPYYRECTEKVVYTSQLQIYHPSFIGSVTSSQIITFLDKNKDGFIHGGTLLHLAIVFDTSSKFVSRFSSKILQLVNLPDKDGRTPLHYTAVVRSPRSMVMLQKSGADFMIKDNFSNTLYHYIDNADYYKMFIAKSSGMPVPIDESNDLGQHPIHLFCAHGSVEMLKGLVESIEDMSCLYITDKEGKMPLDYCLMNTEHKFEVIQYMHSIGVENRLIAAVEAHDYEKVHELVEAGYPVNSWDTKQQTPLHAATNLEDIKMVEFLIQYGADVSKTNSHSQTPIHLAAKKSNLEMCKIILAQHFEITNLSPSEQPFLLAEDPKCRDFLYHYWKREHFIKQLVTQNLFYSMKTRKISGNSNPPLQMQIREELGQDILPVITEAKIKISMSGNSRTAAAQFFDIFMEFVVYLSFISEKVIEIYKDAVQPYSFMTSIHHLLMVLSTINIMPFCNSLMKNFKQIVDDIESNLGPNARRVLVAITYPMQWTQRILEQLQRIENHLLDGIDDRAIYSLLLSRVQTQVQETQEPTQLLSKKLCQPLFPTDTVIGYANCKVEEVQSNPQCTFNIQFLNEMKIHFNKSFALPRCIPFSNRQQVEVFLFESSILIKANDNDWIHFPLFFLQLKPITHRHDLIFSSPVGLIHLSSPQQPKNTEKNFQATIIELMYKQLRTTLEYKMTHIHQFNDGALRLQVSKDKLFHCLVSYQISGQKNVSSRFLLVNAGNSAECYDIASAHLNEIFSAPPVFLNVHAIEIAGNDHLVSL